MSRILLYSPSVASVIWDIITSMERTLVRDTVGKVGETVIIKGWVNTKRDHSKIVFIDLRDRSGLVQVVGTGELLGTLKTEEVISIEGLVKSRPERLINPNLETGSIEIEAVKMTVLSTSAELPIDMGKETLDVELPTLLDNRSLSFRHPKVQAIFKVQSVVIDAFRKALPSIEQALSSGERLLELV